MESIKELYRIGYGPSSSHTMAPRRAVELYRKKHPHIQKFRVTLYGSLAATGKGHLTDQALRQAFSPLSVQILWKPEKKLPAHANGMRFEALDDHGHSLDHWQVYSIGGGALWDESSTATAPLYPLSMMAQVLHHLENSGQTFWEYVQDHEGEGLWPFLQEVWQVMEAAVQRGMKTEGVLPGDLGLMRKAWSLKQRAGNSGALFRRTGLIACYALAVAEENAAGGRIVTAPTCGACGVVPAVFSYLKKATKCSVTTLLRGLATAGLVGNFIKKNASISGADVGCQGEIGAACAMAAGAAVQILGGTVRQIEYVAEMGLEHHLGLTCDPVAGLVQIPCIERNAFAAERALSCAEYALFSDGSHRISFDEVIHVMRQTGHDLPSLYRETAQGGLAAAYRKRKRKL